MARMDLVMVPPSPRPNPLPYSIMSVMFRRLQPHVPGMVYAALLALVGVAAMNNQNNLLFWVLGVMVSGMAISAFISSVIMWSLRVRRIDPQHGAVGEPLVVRYAVTNRSRWLSAFNIHIEERPSGPAQRSADWRGLMGDAQAWVMHIGPRETVHGEAVFWPTRRGQALFNTVRISTTFPFGIVRKSTTISQPQHTLIYPMLHELRRGVLSAIAPAGLMGTKITHHAGAGDDYYGTREFRPGDSLRHIAWKRTAQLDELVSIERTRPSPAKLRVILDLTTPTDMLRVEANSPHSPRDLEERAISLAASIIHAADLNGYEVGLSVLGSPLPPMAVRRNRWHRQKLMAALAEINLDMKREAARSHPIRDAERAGLVVISPDRVQPLAGREDALYLTARQLESLSIGQIAAGALRPESSSSSSRQPAGFSEAAA